MTWAKEEFAGADLGDKRLNRRRMKLTECFADKPTASLPGACPDWGETQAVYRFFDQANNDKRPLGWETILTPHMARTEARMRQHRVVLCLQDTTELNFNGQGIDGLGLRSYEAQRGMYLHPTYVVTPAREPLGITDAWMGSRAMPIPEGVGGLLNVTCLLAKEINPPAGCKAVEWRLLTNRTATDFADAVELMDGYRC